MTDQTTHAQFGKRFFHGEEKRGYINAIYDGIIGNTNHGIKGGLSFVFVDLTQKLDTLVLPRIEYVPGAFAEYTYKGLRFTGVLGARGDYHNLYGFQFSPRFHGKFSLTEKLDLRFTAGRGFRVPNVIIDNVSLLATSRNWVIEKNIQAEVSWNVGGSIVQEFKFFKRKGNISIDFQNFPDNVSIGGLGKVTLELTADNIARTLSFISSGGVTFRRNATFPTPFVVTSQTAPIIIEVWRRDSNNIFLNYLGQFS